MVLNELYQQQLEMFDDLNKRLENVSMPNMQYDRAFNYGEYLETTFKKAIMELKQGIVAVEVVDFPASDRLNSIISRAIKKEPPFEGKEKHSDKGFKDVLIWESIKEYKEKHINDTIVFYCNDNLLASNALRKEFKEDFRDEIYIEQKNALMKRLTTLCNKNETGSVHPAHVLLLLDNHIPYSVHKKMFCEKAFHDMVQGTYHLHSKRPYHLLEVPLQYPSSRDKYSPVSSTAQYGIFRYW